jgi:hypothetical protein
MVSKKEEEKVKIGSWALKRFSILRQSGRLTVRHNINNNNNRESTASIELE